MKLGTRLKRIKRIDTEHSRLVLEYADGFAGNLDLSFIFGNPTKKPLAGDPAGPTVRQVLRRIGRARVAERVRTVPRRVARVDHAATAASSCMITLGHALRGSEEPLLLFALLSLGLVQSLASGVLTPEEAADRFFSADNCLFVRRHLRNRTADAIMSRGVQLPDLFTALPAAEARREFYAELELIRTLCLKLLGFRWPHAAGRAAA